MGLELDKTSVGRGDSVMVSPTDACISSDGAGQVTVTFDHASMGPEQAPVDVGADGMWETPWLVLEDEPAGDYTVTASCDLGESTPNAAYEVETFRVTEYPAATEGLDFTISPAAPATATPGGAVSLSSVNPCPTHGVERYAAWGVWSLRIDGEDIYFDELLNYGDAILAGNGTWTASFAAPQSEGAYGVSVVCVRTGFRTAGDDIEAEFPATAFYDAQALLVGPNTSNPGPLPDNNEVPGTPGTPKPANARSGRPNLTG